MRIPPPISAWKAVPDCFPYSLCTALQAAGVKFVQFPAHPRFTRMYGVTHSTVFQTDLL